MKGSLWLFAMLLVSCNALGLPDINNLRGIEGLDSSARDQLTSSIEAQVDYATELLSEPERFNLTEDDLTSSLVLKVLDTKEKLENDIDTNQLEEFSQFLQRNVAANAKFPLVSGSVDSKSTVYTVQYIAYKEVEENGEKKYLGFGLFMTIDTSSLDGGASSSLPFLVAKATVENKQYAYGARLVGIEGVAGLELLRSVMPVGDFGIGTYVGYEKFKDLLIAGLKDGTIKIKPVFLDPMFVLGSLEADRIAMARVYGLMQIAKRIKLGDALTNSTSQESSSLAEIRKVYEEHANITKLSKKPSKKASEKAIGMLAEIDVTVET